jgi:hypothetical protein
MKKFDIFPTLIGSETYNNHEQFKSIFFEEVQKYLREDGVTGEASGHVDLHHNPKFEDFFKFVSSQANDYIETLVGSKDMWEPWIVKTWFSDFSVNQHDHADAHLSFVYYVNIPEDKQHPLHFIPPANRLNDLTNGMFLFNKDHAPINSYNEYNCNSVSFPPEEGALIIFPAKLQHAVECINPRPTGSIETSRISLAGDFLLTFRQPSARSMGLQPVSNWRSFG